MKVWWLIVAQPKAGGDVDGRSNLVFRFPAESMMEALGIVDLPKGYEVTQIESSETSLASAWRWCPLRLAQGRTR